MSKSYLKNAEERSIFLGPVAVDGEETRKGERGNTSPLGEARYIDIERIRPDPEQPRKTFSEEALESLAESIQEIGGIIDPVTVEYEETQDHFRIISGERRYRAANIVGLKRLPCIIKEVDDQQRLLLQLIANLQREDITALDEAAGIKALIERFQYSQTKVAKLLNKSKSYVSQIVGLERLGQSAREIVQTSELSKEIQIQASREKDPEKQANILENASKVRKTVRQVRSEERGGAEERPDSEEASTTSGLTPATGSHDERKFNKWTWRSKDGTFAVAILFREEQNESEKSYLVSVALKKAYQYAITLTD